MSANVVIIGGTTEGREAARALAAAGFDVVVSTATEYGAQLAAEPETAARSGALDAEGIGRLAADAVAIVDASHPFAREASANAREAARAAGVAYVRFEREDSAASGALAVTSAEQAAAAAVEAAGDGGTVLLTVGSRTLPAYVDVCRSAGVRCVARVLPVPESLAACAQAGLSAADVIAMQGPTSAELDEALLRHLGATVLVTKASGATGGVPEKLEAARRVGALAIVVARPEDTRHADVTAVRSADALVAHVLALAPDTATPAPTPAASTAITSESSAPSHVEPTPDTGLVHIYTGDGKGKTTAGVGLAVRAAGAGLQVAFVQFVKGGAESAELASLRRLGIHVVRPAKRSSGLMRSTITADDVHAGAAALVAARQALSGGYDLVVLDEACVAARSGLVATNALADVVRDRAAGVEVALTGRGAPDELLALADYVTEMKPHKHPFERGIAARKGIEY